MAVFMELTPSSLNAGQREEFMRSFYRGFTTLMSVG